MLTNPTKLMALIDEYRRLRELGGFTPQSRGQRFNSFLAELLQCWSINAFSNVRGSGEIDVAFELNGRNFVLEAKWERASINTDPIAKLQKRVRQRLAGTIGLLLSMSGFKSEAIKDLKEGEQLSVLLLTREHFEAMLSGFNSPEEIISGAVRRASNYGEGYTALQDLFESPPASLLKVTFEMPNALKNVKLIVDSVPSFDATIVASDFSMRQSGVAELTKSKILLTLEEGIYEVDLTENTISRFLGMPNCSRNALVARDGSVYVVKGRGVARIRKSEFQIVAGGLVGSVCLFHGQEDEVWAFSNGHPTAVESWTKPHVTLIGSSIGNEERIPINYSPACGTNASLIGERRFLIVGSFGTAIVEPGAQTLLLNRDQNMGLVRISEDKFLLSSGGIDLSELEVSTHSVKRIAKLRLQGLVSELANSVDGGGYLLAHYQTAQGVSAGAVIRWRY